VSCSELQSVICSQSKLPMHQDYAHITSSLDMGWHRLIRYRVAVCCSELQRVAARCSRRPLPRYTQSQLGLQHTATHCNTQSRYGVGSIRSHRSLHCKDVLQCVAVCCSVLQCVAVRSLLREGVLQCIAERCRVLQWAPCTARVCCSVLQCVVVRCSWLHTPRVCVAACCNVLQ